MYRKIYSHANSIRVMMMILRHERGQGNIHFPCSADHEQDWQPYPVDPYLAIRNDHIYNTYIHKKLLQCISAEPLLSSYLILRLGLRQNRRER